MYIHILKKTNTKTQTDRQTETPILKQTHTGNKQSHTDTPI